MPGFQQFTAPAPADERTTGRPDDYERCYERKVFRAAAPISGRKAPTIPGLLGSASAVEHSDDRTERITDEH